MVIVDTRTNKELTVEQVIEGLIQIDPTIKRDEIGVVTGKDDVYIVLLRKHLDPEKIRI